MSIFDLNKITEGNRFSDNLSTHDPISIENRLSQKIEAQRWCLGLDTQLQYHTEMEGLLIPIDTSNLTLFVTHTADEDAELGSASIASASNSVIEEAKFMQQLGNNLKARFNGLTFQQFSSPMRRMRGAGGAGWTLHNTGEAIDLFYSDKATLVNWLVENADNLKLKVIIDYVNQRSWNSSRRTWKHSDSIVPSYNHIHIDRGGYRRNGQGLSPEVTISTNVRKIVGGL